MNDLARVELVTEGGATIIVSAKLDGVVMLLAPGGMSGMAMSLVDAFTLKMMLSRMADIAAKALEAAEAAR